MKLLTVNSNAKTIKGNAMGYLTGILYLAPARQATGPQGATLCPHASPGCLAACLYTAGRAGIFRAINESRVRKTKALLADKAGFILQLEKDILELIRKAKRENLTPCVRLNGTSDIRVEDWGLMEKFPNIQFYDYTKNPVRAVRYANGGMPANYHLTFSLSETNQAEALSLLSIGVNVAAVFHKALPAVALGSTVIDGDLSDLRFLDPKGPRGIIVGLKAKGKAKKDETGFSIA